MTPEEAVIYLSLGKGLFGMTLGALPKGTAVSVGKVMEAMDYAERTFETQILVEQMNKMKEANEKNKEEEDDDDAGSADDQ